MKQDFYDMVGVELSVGYTDHGLMARAIDESNGNEHLAQSLYVRYRVEKLGSSRKSVFLVARI